MDEARLRSLYAEYCSSNPYIEAPPFEIFKIEMYGISAPPPPAPMGETEARNSPVAGVYKQNPGMPPASTGIPDCSKAMVSTKCPHCHGNGQPPEEGQLETNDVFGKLRAVVGGPGKKLAMQLVDGVRSMKGGLSREAYSAEVVRALEAEIARKKHASPEKAREDVSRWAERWNRLWEEFVVPSRASYKHAHVTPSKKESNAGDVASAVYAMLDKEGPELGKEMLSAMNEVARLTGEEGIDLLSGVFGSGGAAPTPEQEELGRMFGTTMKSHLGSEKARMAAAAFKKGADRAMMAAAADGGGGDEGELSTADYEPVSKNSQLAEFVDSRSASLKLAPEESYILILPDSSVEPDLLSRIEDMSRDDAANYVRAHAIPIGSMTQEGEGATRFVTLSGKTYAVVQLGEEAPVVYEIDASGKRVEEGSAAQVGGPIHKSGGRLFFMFFRRRFVKPEDAGKIMISAGAKKAGGSAGGHGPAHHELESHPHLSSFAKMAHETKVDHGLSHHTVFAPKNSALSKAVPAERQRRFVEGHIVKGRLEKSSELHGRKKTLAGTEITIDGARGTVDGVKYKLAKAHPHLVIYEIDSPLVK